MNRSSKKSEDKKSSPKATQAKAHGKSGEPKHSLLVSVTDDHLDQIDQLAEKLEKEGYEVDQVMRITGGITLKGSGDPEANKRQIQRMAGVNSVEIPQGYRIAPPESDVQ